MIKKIAPGQSDYPRLLSEINDPPQILRYDGDLSILAEPCIAVVGSRKCTKYGEAVAKRIAKRAAESGITIVSGMALGVDSAAHIGCLEAGGKTVAVMGCGLDICYPASNKRLMESIRKEGLLLSEYDNEALPKPYNFPRRNRIISGLCASTVVVEAARESGSLITAELAASQGRSVYAVPGDITSRHSFGANMLIHDGAIPLIIIDDIIRDMGISPSGDHDAPAKLGKDESKIYDLLSDSGEMTVDEICEKIMLSPEKVNSVLTVLEIKGLTASSLGKIFAV